MATEQADRSLSRWSEIVEPLLTPAEIAQLPEEQLFAVPTGNGFGYPAMQIKDGQLLAGFAETVAALAPVIETPYTIIGWLTSPSPALDELTPLDWLRQEREPETVIVEAQRYASVLAR
jgi:hypothetical protein